MGVGDRFGSAKDPPLNLIELLGYAQVSWHPPVMDAIWLQCIGSIVNYIMLDELESFRMFAIMDDVY